MDVLIFKNRQERKDFFSEMLATQKETLEFKISTSKSWLTEMDSLDRPGFLKSLSDKEVYAFPALILFKSKYISKPRAMWWMHSKRQCLLQSSPLLTSYFVNEVMFYQSWLYGQYQKTEDAMMTYDELYNVISTFNIHANTPYINTRIIRTLMSGLHYRFDVSFEQQKQLLTAIIGIRDPVWNSDDLSYIYKDLELNPMITEYLKEKDKAFEAMSCQEETQLLLS